MIHCAHLLLGSNGGMMGSGSQHFATVRDIGLLGENKYYNVTQYTNSAISNVRTSWDWAKTLV